MIVLRLSLALTVKILKEFHSQYQEGQGMTKSLELQMWVEVKYSSMEERAMILFMAQMDSRLLQEILTLPVRFSV